MNEDLQRKDLLGMVATSAAGFPTVLGVFEKEFIELRNRPTPTRFLLALLITAAFVGVVMSIFETLCQNDFRASNARRAACVGLLSVLLLAVALYVVRLSQQP